jgi:hypothetical protein
VHSLAVVAYHRRIDASPFQRLLLWQILFSESMHAGDNVVVTDGRH